jgi:hypothetical protein
MGEPLRCREQPIGHPFRCHRVELANIASNMCQIDQCEPGEPYVHGGGGSSSGFPQLSSHRATSARGMSESRGNARAAAMARCLASVSSTSNRSRSGAGSEIRRGVKIAAAKAPRPRAGEGGTRASGRVRVRADAWSKETLFRRLRGPTLIRLGSRSPPSPASGRRAGRSDPVAATIFTDRLSALGRAVPMIDDATRDARAATG